MSFDTKFGTIWLPEIHRLVYIKDKNSLVVGPEFYDKFDATAAYEEYISKWNRKSIKMQFIVDEESYEFMCYQDPKTSHSKTNLCLYKDLLNKNGVFLKEREVIERQGCKLGVHYKTSDGYKSIGIPFPTNVEIISAEQVIPNSYEDIIRKL